jgi:putative oxidoreductase
MSSLVSTVRCVHDAAFGALSRLAQGWFLGLAARLVFSSVTMVFFLNSVKTKVGSGFPDILIPQVGAYAQILPPVAEAAGYNPDNIAFFWKLVVLAGTYAEFLLPVLILVGLFTRLASVAMIGFIAVMSIVDVWFHHLDAASIGAMFDRLPTALIFDQRLLWLFPLVYLVIKGAGKISLDGLLASRANG